MTSTSQQHYAITNCPAGISAQRFEKYRGVAVAFSRLIIRTIISDGISTIAPNRA
jgi:hypothetical protein